MSIQHRRNGRRRRQGGFTLIELGVALAIVALLVAIAVPTYLNMVKRAREAEAQQVWNMVKTELWSYYVENNKFPPIISSNTSQWWSGIDEPTGTNWTYKASGDETQATLTATLKNGDDKLCWSIDSEGKVTTPTNCP